MATLLKPWITRYLDANGRQVRKGTPGARKVKERSTKWYGQYVDVDGRRRRIPLCTDKVAARQMLVALEREVQLGRAGVVDPYAGHRRAPIETHIEDYRSHLANKGVTAAHLKETTREIRAVLEHCGAKTLAGLCPEGVERFLAVLTDKGTGATTRNRYLASIKAFAKWCLRTRRTGEDMLACLRPASGAVRRKRRALTADELLRLLRAARERPLAMARTVNSGPRKGQQCLKLHPERQAELERIGWERSLVYKTLVLTGLRRGELEALEVRHLTLEGPRPCLVLPGEKTKNHEDASIPLRADLIADIREWLRVTGKSGSDRLFRVPEELIKSLKKDLVWAGIEYRDAQGRTVDVHSLRHTTGTHLAKAKVSPRVAQRFMRHSDIKLTMQIYTDPQLLDEAEALAALPDMPLDADRPGQGEQPPAG
jgi:integrase